MAHNLRIDINRLWTDLMASAAIGRTEKCGLRRLALSVEDGEMRRLFAGWCAAAGLTVSVDAMGNMFARRAGKNPNARAIMMASHLDTQIHGGRFDGILGVLGALEVIRTLNDNGIETEHPLIVCNWTNEEGARFEPPMLGSRIFCGFQDAESAHAIRDKDGVAFGAALDAIGYRGADRLTPADLDSYFELHIEQGPELDEKKVQVGAVAGAFDVRWAVIEVTGDNAHAGPTRMVDRRNALVGAAAVVMAINDIGWAYAASGGRTTTARLSVEPNLLGIISHRAELLCDFRHPVRGIPQDMFEAFLARLPALRLQTQCAITVARDWRYGAMAYDAGLTDLVRQSADDLGYSRMDLLTVAGHDSMNMASVVPSAMIFTPCEKGISHNEAENVTPADIEPGVNVLLHAVLKRDRQSAV
jgi:N-carbamoyl-L-amino-acid hydrolase